MAKWRNWREALGLTALDYTVPVHANTFWYSLGGITTLCFVVTFVTGVVLTQFYNPSPAAAHPSVRYIANTPILWMIQSLHHWSANLGFVLLIGHMLRVIFTGAYRPPRTINYLIGLALFLVTFQLFFTGTVIKWDQEGYEALAHFVAVNKLLGSIGAVFQEDFTLSTSMLSRINALHVGIFPILLVILIILHALYVWHFGIAPKPYQNDVEYQASLAKGTTFTKHLVWLSIYGLILLLLLLGLAYLMPPSMLEAPKPGIEVTKPPWPFWIFYPIEGVVGILGILLGSLVILSGLILVPILGLIIREEKKLFRFVNTMVIVGLVIWLAMLVTAYFLPTMKHI